MNDNSFKTLTDTEEYCVDGHCVNFKEDRSHDVCQDPNHLKHTTLAYPGSFCVYSTVYIFPVL